MDQFVPNVLLTGQNGIPYYLYFAVAEVQFEENGLFSTVTPIDQPGVNEILMDTYLSLDNGVYTGFAEVSEVPIPAAAWLFGSAFIGLAGIKRKK